MKLVACKATPVFQPLMIAIAIPLASKLFIELLTRYYLAKSYQALLASFPARFYLTALEKNLGVAWE